MAATDNSSAPIPLGPKPTIVLVHGLWMAPNSWEGWIERFSAAGYKVIAPAWPGLEGRSVEDIRKDPSALKGLGLKAVVDHYDKIIRELETPPIIMGHSFGGLFTEMLLSRGLGCAGVAIDPAAPSGISTLPFSAIKSTFVILGNPLTFNAAVPLSPAQFHYAFANTLSEAASKAVWEKYAIPAAAKVLWQSALGLLNKHGVAAVDFAKKDRAPLLLVQGLADHIVPAVTTRNVKHHYTGPAVVEMKEFPGRTHWICGQDGWEEVADYALEWVEAHLVK